MLDLLDLLKHLTNPHPYEALPEPMLVEVGEGLGFINSSSVETGMRGMAVAKKISYGEPWYLVLISEKLIWFRVCELKKV